MSRTKEQIEEGNNITQTDSRLTWHPEANGICRRSSNVKLCIDVSLNRYLFVIVSD